MPKTYLTFIIGSLSLAGIVPLAGFWSKDEILSHAFSGGNTISSIVFALALIAAFMTAFYMFRAVFMTFHGNFKGGADRDPDAHSEHPIHLEESPATMTWPLIILAVPAVVAGFLANSIFDLGIIPAHWMTHFLDYNPFVHVESTTFNIAIAGLSTVMALLGIGLAYLMYIARAISPEGMGRAFRPIHTLLYRKYFMDELYEDVIVRGVFYKGIAYALDWVDKSVVDKITNFCGWLGANTGTAIRPGANRTTASLRHEHIRWHIDHIRHFPILGLIKTHLSFQVKRGI